MENVEWYVTHTKPRCEKKLVQFCHRETIPATLPLYSSIHKYRGKTVRFEKPLFPGYVFIQIVSSQRRHVLNSDYVANLLHVHDQEQFAHQLEEILIALDSGLEIQIAPEIGKGTKVLIKSGPLRGLDGWVEERYGPTTVLLRLDFIGQAAAVKLEATNLEPIT